MVSIEIAQVTSEKMQAMYRLYWTPILDNAIYEAFKADVTDADYQEAFKRHTLVSKFAPTVAEIREQLANIYADRIRAKKQAHFNRYGRESDDTYKQLMSGTGDTSRGAYWAAKIKEQLALSTQIRHALAAKYQLDYRTPEANKLLLTVLDKARDGDGMLVSVARAVAVAGRLLAAGAR